VLLERALPNPLAWKRATGDFVTRARSTFLPRRFLLSFQQVILLRRLSLNFQTDEYREEKRKDPSRGMVNQVAAWQEFPKDKI
jgi:hypothetical protein